MIPKSFIQEWAQKIPWPMQRQVEQDLIISVVLIKLYECTPLNQKLAFRGGTALNKLFFNPPTRYSEDIDLVQTIPEPIGATVNLLRNTLFELFGEPKRNFSEGRATLIYRIQSEDNYPIRLKIEINTREHNPVLGFENYNFECSSSWISGRASILTYRIEELLGTKMRAMYQRRKGRDLFDLFIALTTIKNIDTDAVVCCFSAYTRNQSSRISKAMFMENMTEKLKNKGFTEDIRPLLPNNFTEYDPEAAYELVRNTFIEKLR